jgi:hypothetical protein
MEGMGHEDPFPATKAERPLPDSKSGPLLLMIDEGGFWGRL